jgi:endoglucanase
MPQELSPIRHAWDVWAVATVQEEETLAGAFTSPVDAEPDIAVAIDVTFAKGPGANDHRTMPFGKGVTLGWGPNTHPAVFEAFKKVADRLDIPFQTEVSPSQSGTDAMGLQMVGAGLPSLYISIPIRYMHTPVELVSMKDIQRAGHLLAQTVPVSNPISPNPSGGRIDMVENSTSHLSQTFIDLVEKLSNASGFRGGRQRAPDCQRAAGFT